jgi:hypothetical protein
MNVFRGLVAVIAGLVVTRLLVPPLEITLANALAQQPLRTTEDLAAALNTPVLMVARVLYNGVGALLGGYVTARVAAHDPMRYTMVAAAFQALLLTWAFVTGNAPPMPLWLRIALGVVSTVAIVAGGGVRAAVAALPQNQPHE